MIILLCTAITLSAATVLTSVRVNKRPDRRNNRTRMTFSTQKILGFLGYFCLVCAFAIYGESIGWEAAILGWSMIASLCFIISVFLWQLNRWLLTALIAGFWVAVLII